MLDIGAVSYSLASLAFIIFSLLLMTSWKGRLQGALLVMAVLATVVWAVASTSYFVFLEPSSSVLLAVEVLRNVFWIAFLIQLLSSTETERWYVLRLRGVMIVVLMVSLILLGALFIPNISQLFYATFSGVDIRLLGMVLLVIVALVLLEQVYRNSEGELRWAVKYMCIGLGGVFIFDFIFYADALLFLKINTTLWQARGVVAALAAPLLAVSASRNPDWSVEIFVSRSVTFHTSALLGAGLYLLVMAAGGYYIRSYGGEWGQVAQSVFWFMAVITLMLLLMSGQLRARLRVFINKHFYQYKYDYREEWLRLIQTLSFGSADGQFRERAVIALAEIADSRGGVLWLRQETGDFLPVAMETVHVDDVVLCKDEPLIRFLKEREWVVNLPEFRAAPSICEGLILPECMEDMPWAWLIVPLMNHDELLAFIVLAESRSPRQINWEDRDLLKTAGRQIAGYLAQYEAAQALVHARQFEAINRLSTFMVHDLKNLIAQLSLVVSNADKHKHNQEFIEDMIATVGHAVSKMNELLVQLRAGRSQPLSVPENTSLDDVLKTLIKERSATIPLPSLVQECSGIQVRIDKKRLLTVLGHLIQNAQDATQADGQIDVVLRKQGDSAVIEISDNGCGMDARFIRERLFQPFDTTKGASGMGIGVYQSREFVRESGGDISVQSELNVGTVFRVFLPVQSHDISSDRELADSN